MVRDAWPWPAKKRGLACSNTPVPYLSSRFAFHFSCGWRLRAAVCCSGFGAHWGWGWLLVLLAGIGRSLQAAVTARSLAHPPPSRWLTSEVLVFSAQIPREHRGKRLGSG